MLQSHDSLRQLLYARLDEAKVDTAQLLSESSEVVIFGSRALGVNRESSDLDVLCFGNHHRVVSRKIDLVFLPVQEMHSMYWTGSELAFHVSVHGVWLKGEGEWRSSVFVSDRAIRSKQRRLESLIRNSRRRWSSFHHLFQVKYATSIRRELQRLNLLLNRVPIPPTPILDRDWQSGMIQCSDLLALIQGIPDVELSAADWVKDVFDLQQ